MHRFGLIALAAALPACSQPQNKSAFRSDLASERIEAIGDAGREHDRSKIPDLVDSLESSDAGERMLAAETLEQMSGGQTLGYHYEGTPAERREAVKRWRAWADEQGGRNATSR